MCEAIYIEYPMQRKKKKLDSSSKRYALPRVSILIVNYNGSRWLKAFMPVLIKTEYPDFEIIVVDNGSTDESLKYLSSSRSDSLKVVELPDNKGFAAGVNIAADAATGKVLVMLNNDIEVSSNWLTEAVSKLLSDPHAAVVQSMIMQYRERHKIDCVGISVDRYGILQVIGHGESDVGQYDHLDEIGVASGGALVVWKDIFYKVGCLDTNLFMYYEDIDFGWRIRAAGYKILPAISSKVYHVGSASSKMASPTFVPFHWAKNYTFCWLKNSSTREVATLWPVSLLVIISWIVFALVMMQPSTALAYLKGAVWTLVHIGNVLEQRKKFSNLIKRPIGYNDALFVKKISKEYTNLGHLVRQARRRLKE